MKRYRSFRLRELATDARSASGSARTAVSMRSGLVAVNVRSGSKTVLTPLKWDVCTPRRQTSVSYAADCDVIVCYGEPRPAWHRLPPPGRALHAYQTSGHLPVAVPHAFVLIRPTTGVDTSAHAICGLILTSRRVCHCFCR
jgi:hypothetical protein